MGIYLLFSLLLLPMVAVFAWRLLISCKSGTAGATLHPRDVLQRDAQAMYLRLRAALPQYVVFARTSLASFVDVKGSRKSAVNVRQAELARQTVDFLICSGDFRIVAAVELEDIMHGRREHERGSTLLREAAIPVLRWTTVSLPTIRDIQEAVAEIETQRLIGLGMHGRGPAAAREHTGAGLGKREPRL